ncbi:MAG: histidine kinase [Methylophilaceae bacterium]
MNKPKRDLIFVLLTVVIVHLLAIHFDLAERLIAITSIDESLQLDEIPIVMFAAAVMAAWFSYRRLFDLLQETRIRAKAEAELEASQQLYKRLFDEGLSGNFVANLEGTIVLANDVFYSMSGRYPGPLNLKFILGPQWDQIYASLKQKHQTDFFELTAQRPDGAPWIVSARFTYAMDANNPESRKIHGFFYDITEQYLAEQELAQLLRENQQLARHAMKVQEDERKNLAREIHDDMGQYLTAIRMDALAMQNAATAKAPELAQRISSHAEHIQLSIKTLIKRLRPAALDTHGLVEALKLLVDEWQAQQPDTKCNLSIDDSCMYLPTEVSIIAYRMVQEALTNIARHANAHQVDINVEMASKSQADILVIQVKDDGVGFSGSTAKKGFGLTGMRERVESAGGVLTITNNDYSGVFLGAKIPVPRN